MNQDHQNIRELDPLYAEAKAIVLDKQRASISLIQRHMRIGYNHAARLLEAMEGDVVTHPDENGVRQILQEGGEA